MQTMACLRCGLLAVIGAFLSACAADHYTASSSPSVPPPASFAHRAASPDIELFWNCSQPQPQAMKITGTARNSGQREVRSVELTVRSLRAGDVPILQTAEALPEIILYAAGPSPFQIDLPLENTPSRIDISAAYIVTLDLSAPSTAGPQGSLIVEDACAPTRYPNPVPR